jgi:hypothetical protein
MLLWFFYIFISYVICYYNNPITPIPCSKFIRPNFIKTSQIVFLCKQTIFNYILLFCLIKIGIKYVTHFFDKKAPPMNQRPRRISIARSARPVPRTGKFLVMIDTIINSTSFKMSIWQLHVNLAMVFTNHYDILYALNLPKNKIG